MSGFVRIAEGRQLVCEDGDALRYGTTGCKSGFSAPRSPFATNRRAGGEDGERGVVGHNFVLRKLPTVVCRARAC